MSTRTRQRIGYSTLVVLFVALVVAVIASNVWLRGARLDLTENGLYTLGNGTKAVLKDIKEPIDLYFFFSNDSTKNLQQIRAYANRVREMLEEFAASTPDGKLVLHVVDPVPFSEDEDRAEQFGLQAANIGAAGDNVYFGLAGSNSIGKTDTIAFFDPRKEMFLEYDLARLVYNLSNTTPNILYELVLGGVLSATLVPLFTQTNADHDDETASVLVTVKYAAPLAASIGLVRAHWPVTASSSAAAAVVSAPLVAAVSAFLIFVQHDFKRKLAYHSVEHVGLIVIGLGLYARARGAWWRTGAALALLAAKCIQCPCT